MWVEEEREEIEEWWLESTKKINAGAEMETG
jgi:hypothetical protein